MSTPTPRLKAVLSTLALVLVAAPATAQEPEPAAHIYEAYYKINFADMAEWDRLFTTYALPALRDMQSEGRIEGWGHWQHNVGGEHNVRMAVRVRDWADIPSFWSAWGEHVYGAMSPEDQAVIDELIESHYDEIWDIGRVSVRDGAAMNHMYASTFAVSDVQEWDRMWEDQVIPVLEGAMEADILEGVVLLNHNTGLTHNRKVLYFFEEWDDMDDMWNLFFGTMGSEHPESLNEMLSMVEAHDDIIWAAVPSENR